MSECPDLKAGDQVAEAEHECLAVRISERTYVEVAMRKTLSAVVAAAVAVALFVGAALSVTTNVQGRRDVSRQGLMPEIVVTAEKPRLVMPTVEVHAFRTLATNGSGLNVN
jgi:redox-regulated HSP33 family molecular chaperone